MRPLASDLYPHAKRASEDECNLYGIWKESSALMRLDKRAILSDKYGKRHFWAEDTASARQV